MQAVNKNQLFNASCLALSGKSLSFVIRAGLIQTLKINLSFPMRHPALG